MGGTRRQLVEGPWWKGGGVLGVTPFDLIFEARKGFSTFLVLNPPLKIIISINIF